MAAIDAATERDLVRRLQQGDRRAGSALVLAHEPTIYWAVRPCYGQGLDRADVMQAGRLGFYYGATRFDPDRGVRLATYASDWARRFAQEEIGEAGAVIRVRLTARYEMSALLRAGKALPPRLQRTRRLLRMQWLDAPGPDDEAPLVETLESDSPTPEDALGAAAAARASAEHVAAALAKLTPRERTYVERRFLSDDPPTQAELGAAMGVTKVRAGQIERAILAKLARMLRSVEKERESLRRPPRTS